MPNTCMCVERKKLYAVDISDMWSYILECLLVDLPILHVRQICLLSCVCTEFRCIVWTHAKTYSKTLPFVWDVFVPVVVHRPAYAQDLCTAETYVPGLDSLLRRIASVRLSVRVMSKCVASPAESSGMIVSANLNHLMHKVLASSMNVDSMRLQFDTEKWRIVNESTLTRLIMSNVKYLDLSHSSSDSKMLSDALYVRSNVAYKNCMPSLSSLVWHHGGITDTEFSRILSIFGGPQLRSVDVSCNRITSWMPSVLDEISKRIVSNLDCLIMRHNRLHMPWQVCGLADRLIEVIDTYDQMDVVPRSNRWFFLYVLMQHVETNARFIDKVALNMAKIFKQRRPHACRVSLAV